MRARFAILASLLSLSPAAALAADYTIDPKHTQVVFGIGHMGLSTFYGRLSDISGSLSFDPAKPAESRLEVQIAAGSVNTLVGKLDDELKKDFFDTEKFPTITFKSTSAATTGEKTGTVTGDLTIKGVTKPVTLTVTYNGNRNTKIGFDAKASIKRSDFGLTTVAWSKFVGDEVDLLIEAELSQKQ